MKTKEAIIALAAYKFCAWMIKEEVKAEIKQESEPEVSDEPKTIEETLRDNHELIQEYNAIKHNFGRVK